MKKKKLADKSYKGKKEKRVQYYDALFFFVETPL
jgi:effector-binding domain-containing protein